MSAREDRADEALRGVLRALGDGIRREFAGGVAELGPYRALRLIGAGGTSEVFAAARADDADASVRFAVKVVRPGADVREVLARFERERELIARVAHPAIVPVLESGVAPDGRPWFAMPLVEGDPVTIAAKRMALPAPARAALALRAVEAVAAAHAVGVIHRDLKPGNILVEGPPESARPRLIDFGIARALGGGQSRLTPNDHVHRLGTPAYMAPEQWRDGVGACDRRSDVFALGLILGEVVAGRIPRETSDARRGGRARPGPVVPPSGLAEAADRAWVARRIDPVFAAATAEDPARRHVDAAALAAALRDTLSA